MKFFVKSATKMPHLTPCRAPVSHIKYLKLVQKVCEDLSQHKKLVSSPNEGVEDHSGGPNGRKMRFLVKSATKTAPWTPGGPLWGISSIQNSLVRSVKICRNIISWSAVQIMGLKTIQENQMVGKWVFWSNQPPKCPNWPPAKPLRVISSI